MKEKTKFTKRILSFVLAFCMLAAVVPAMPAAEATTDWGDGSGKYHIYDFRKAYTADNSVLAGDIIGTYTTVSDDASSGEMNEGLYSDTWYGTENVIDESRTDITSLSNITGRYGVMYLTNAVNMGLRVLGAFKINNYIDSPVFAFVVKEDGYYIPKVTLSGSWEGGNTFAGGEVGFQIGKLAADGKSIDGTPIFSSYNETAGSEENSNSGAIDAPITVYLSDTPVKLEAGTYALRMAMPFNTTVNGYERASYTGESKFYTYLKSLELLTKNDYNAKIAVVSGAKAKKVTYDFTQFYGDANYDTQAEINDITYADTLSSDGGAWSIYSYIPANQVNTTSFWDVDVDGFKYNPAWSAAGEKGRGLDMGTAAKAGGAIMLHVPASGNYVVDFYGGNYHGSASNVRNVTYWLMPLKNNRSVETNTAYRATAEGQKYSILTNGVGEYTFNNGEAIALEAGEYILYAGTAPCQDTMFNSLTLTPEGWVEPIEANDIFGSKYAYVQKTGDTYTLHFVGGLNKIEGYAKAGFEIVDTDEVAETAEVYDSISVNGKSYEAADYEAEHIFCATKAGIEPGSTITIKPYVEDAEGNRTYHTYGEDYVEFEITLPSA